LLLTRTRLCRANVEDSFDMAVSVVVGVDCREPVQLCSN
jgi:hypothetical protein